MEVNGLSKILADTGIRDKFYELLNTSRKFNSFWLAVRLIEVPSAHEKMKKEFDTFKNENSYWGGCNYRTWGALTFGSFGNNNNCSERYT